MATMFKTLKRPTAVAIPQSERCLMGAHIPGRRQADPDDPGIVHARCRACGHEIVHSRVFRGWSIRGRLG